MRRPRELQDLGFGVHLVPLSGGRFALIDSADAVEVGRYSWSIDSTGAYARRGVQDADGRTKTIFMHRELTKAPPGMEVDHVNRDGLDNRRANLRLCTPSQNQRNRGKDRSNSSGFKGVSHYKRNGRWRATITIHGKFLHIGLYDTPEEAHAAYCAAAATLHGEFARTA